MKKISIYLILSVILTVLLTKSTTLTVSNFSTGATARPDQITLTWTGDPATTQTVSWRTDSGVHSGEIQYCQYSEDFDSKSKIMKAETSKLNTELGKVNIHSVTLRGLEPGKKYTYRVGTGTNRSEKYFFSTAANNTTNFKFLIFGDSQSSGISKPDYSDWRKTVRNAYNANKDAEFFVNLGDLVNIDLYTHWNKWFSSAEGIVNLIDVIPVGGNHETYKDNSFKATRKPRYLKYLFKVPQNGPKGYKSQVYSCDYGNIHFVVLDSQYNEEKNVDGSILETQKEWLDNDLKKTNKPWKIVLFHKSPFPNMPSRPNNEVRAAFQPIIDKYHVDVVFNGHDHCVARTYAINGDRYLDKPSLGTVYYTAGRSGNKVYNDTKQMKWDTFFCNPKDQPSYIIAEMQGNKLVLTAKKQDGELIDTFTIDKSTDAFSPSLWPD